METMRELLDEALSEYRDHVESLKGMAVTQSPETTPEGGPEMTDDTDRFLAEAEPPEITDEQIYETLKQYEAAGVIKYILPTEPAWRGSGF